jgi:hypothetical protein
MLDWLSRASIGISTMVDEHFGINVVELMVRSLLDLQLTVDPLNVSKGGRCDTCGACVCGTSP